MVQLSGPIDSRIHVDNVDEYKLLKEWGKQEKKWDMMILVI